MFFPSDYFRQRVAMIESGGNNDAQNPNSSAAGKYQFTASTAKQYGLNDPTDEAQATAAFDRFTADNHDYLKKKLGREPTDAELYLAHQQGAAGAARLIRNPDLKAADVVGTKQIALNGGNPDMTAADFTSMWENKFNGGKDVQPSNDTKAIMAGMNQARQPTQMTADSGQIQNDAQPEQPAHSKIDLMLEAERRGILPPDRKALLDEARARGLVPKLDGQTTEDAPIGDRINADLAKRQGKVNQIAQEYLKGNQGFGESAFQQAGQQALAVNDVAGEYFKSIGNKLSSVTPEPVKEAGKSVLNSLADTRVGRDMAGAANELATAHDYIEKNYPRLGRNLDAAGGIGSLVYAAKPTASAIVDAADVAAQGAKVAGKAVVSTGKGVVKAGQAIGDFASNSNIVKGIGARGADALDSAAQAIKARSSTAYSAMRSNGATFTDNFAGQISNDLETALKSDGIVNPRLHDKVLGVLEDFKDRAAKGNLGLEELDQWRQLFGEVAGNHNDPINARKARLLINQIDDTVENLKPSDLASGDMKAVDALNKGREEWQRARKFEAISDIVKKSDGDANYLKRELKKFADNPKKTRGWTPEERAALKQASQLTAGEAVLKALGKFGFDTGKSRIGAGVGAMVGSGVGIAALGTSGGLAAPIAGTAARYAHKAIARGKAETLLHLIEK